jgi:2-polyprenyl-3-methyl-5-hydroxy-6-metoxy-1,4-benzoquinol methylase
MPMTTTIPDPLAPTSVQDKVYEIAVALPGSSCLDVPTGYGALAERLFQAGRTVFGECLIVVVRK